MEALLEKRLHRGGGQVAAADEPFVSLKDGEVSSSPARSVSSPDSSVVVG
jgi:hypothetical protein